MIGKTFNVSLRSAHSQENLLRIYSKRLSSKMSKQRRTPDENSISGEFQVKQFFLFQTIFGQTFLNGFYDNFCQTKSNPLESRSLLSWLMLILSIGYEIIGIVSVMRLHFIFESYSFFEAFYVSSNEKSMMKFIFNLATTSLKVEYFISKITLIFYSKRIIRLLKTIAKDVQLKPAFVIQCRLVYLFLILTISIASYVIFEFIESIEKDQISVFLYVFCALFYGFNKYSIAILMMLFSIMIKQRLNDLQKRISDFENYGHMISEINYLRNKINEFNSIVMPSALVKIFSNSILISATICSIEDLYSLKKTTIISLIPNLLMIILFTADLFSGYSSSQTMLDCMERLIFRVQELISWQSIARKKLRNSDFKHSHGNHNLQHRQWAQSIYQGPITFTKMNPPSSASSINDRIDTNLIGANFRLIDENEFRCLEQISSMRKSFAYNILNIFSLNYSTLMITFGHIISYSILLIQTK
ncbi:hypothetical protein SSS_06548 [Sarcoptes scabiei]|uniref:Uncharacterized protein n=1 Tax=Sarcoptes scabiei TaxID=52283 RepID=A0A834R7K6_SARSC|nr:hypothetical protein SSS_06548 [Sarcoptes scabiei]